MALGDQLDDASEGADFYWLMVRNSDMKLAPDFRCQPNV